MKRKKRNLEFSIEQIDMLNTDFLRRFTSGEGKAAKINSRFINGFPAKFQRRLTKAINRARQLNLM